MKPSLDIKFQILIACCLSPILFGVSIYIFFETNLKETFNMMILIFTHLDQKMKLETYISLIFLFIPFIAVIYLNFKTTLNSHGKARWARISDALKMGLIIKDITNKKKRGFILGKITNKKVLCFNNPLACLVVAPPGSGKSQGVAIPNLLNIKQSCVVLDIKGELWDLTAGYRQKELKNKIFIFDPMKSEKRTNYDLSFNPFDRRIVEKMSIDQKVRLVNEVANTIFVSKEKNHWDEQAKNLFIFYALYDLQTLNETNFYRLAQAPKRDFRKLIHPKSRFYKQVYVHRKNNLVLDENNQPIPEDIEAKAIEKLYYEQIGEQKYCDVNDERNYKEESRDEILFNINNGVEPLLETLSDTARQWAGTPDEEFGSIKSTFNRFMQVFTYNQVKRATETMSFNYEDLREEKITIYIKIAQTDIETLAPLIRIFLESIGKNLLLKENKNPDKFVYLILDEFIRFGKLEFLMEMPALCRSYGVVPIYITQSYALIEKHYSESDLKIINETVAYKILFKMNDEESAEKVSREIGDYTRINRSRTTNKSDILSQNSSSISQEGTRLVSAQDILNIDSKEVIILVTGFKAKPIKLKSIIAVIDNSFKKRIGWEKEKEVIVEEKKEEISQKSTPKEQNQFIQESEEIKKETENELKEYQEFFGWGDDKEYIDQISEKNLFEIQEEIKEEKEYIKTIDEKTLFIKLISPEKIECVSPSVIHKIQNDEEVLNAEKIGKKIEIVNLDNE